MWGAVQKEKFSFLAGTLSAFTMMRPFTHFSAETQRAEPLPECFSVNIDGFVKSSFI
jgi:hypothetical protein